MKDRNVSSYDLRHARQILDDLVPRVGAPAPKKTVSDEETGYLRLSVDSVPARPAFRQTAPMDEPMQETSSPMQESDLRVFMNWEECLDWCMGATRSEAAFVVDSQGFIISSRGRVPGHGFEGAGAELVCSIEQLERIAPDAGKLEWVDLDFDKRTIVGFITPSENVEYYVIGMIAPDRGYHSLKNVIARQVSESLPNLD